MMPTKMPRKPALQNSAPSDHQAQVKQVIPGLDAMDHLLAEDPAVGAPGLSGNEDPEPLWKGAFGAESGPYYSERHQKHDHFMIINAIGNNVLMYFAERSVVIAVQLRRMGDKWNLRQRILNLIAKLFCPGT
ncbi:phorbol-12-myristate-13-acetate-induced protein 1 [Crotalus tigris]|uniref:phorbol-12-myristate-13-acetate-induced protein 1 n=1 Tax=Crotalus tigris TaxID=88082 RepID=UPI00192F454F|nr:phorbol-12-myristate-13-acetate-induced protein 1 [Crotalus tigris]